MNCDFCSREKPLTFHHFIPRTLHKSKYYKKNYESSYLSNHGVNLCKDCHKSIHRMFTNKELGKFYNTKQKLLSNKKFRNYLKWAKKQK